MLSITRQEGFTNRASTSSTESSSGEFRDALVSNMVAKVAGLAKKSKLSYSLDQNTLTRVLGNHLDHLSSLPKDATVSVKAKNNQIDIVFGDFCYSLKDILPGRSPWLQIKKPQQTWPKQQGVFALIPNLNELRLVDGKTMARPDVWEDGRFEYGVRGTTKSMQLVDGLKQNAAGFVAKGQWEAYPLSKSPYYREMCLMKGALTDASGVSYEGSWKYWPLLRSVLFAEGKKISPNGLIEEGVWDYVPEVLPDRSWKFTIESVLICGKKTHPDGRVEEGVWLKSPNVNRMELATEGGEKALILALFSWQIVDGIVIHPTTKHIDQGRFEYISASKSMGLVNGSKFDEKGRLLSRGQYEYVAELGEMALRNGTMFREDGSFSEGVHQYIPALQGVFLVSGSMFQADGKSRSGCWKYSPVERKMMLAQYVRVSLDDVHSDVRWFQDELTSAIDQLALQGKTAEKMEILKNKAEELLSGEGAEFQEKASAFFKAVDSTYRILTLSVHPDKQKVGASEAQKEAAAAIFERLTEISTRVAQKKEEWKQIAS